MLDAGGFPPIPPKERGSNGSAEPLEFLDFTTLQGLPVPEREWLVPHWIPMRRVTAIYGAGGEGKTLLAQMLATACAIDRGNWLGLLVRRCRSTLLFCEDDRDEMWRRQADINQHYGCTFAEIGLMRGLPRLGYDNTLMSFELVRPILTGLFDQLLSAVIERGDQLVIVDTLADVFGGTENDRAQARSFVQTALGGIARQTGAAVVALAHPSLTGTSNGTGSSGSTGWMGTYRSHLYLSTPKPESGEQHDLDARVLSRVKANFARRGETIDLRWQNGVFITDGPAPGVFCSLEKQSCDDVFLRLLNRLIAESRYVSDNSRAGNYAPRVFADQPDRERFKKADFERAMQRLFAEGRIRLGTRKDAYRRKIDCILPADAPP